MENLRARWNALVVVLALATLIGCQGLSTSKPALQGTPNPQQGALTAAPSSISFGNVQTGTSQSLSDTLSNTGATSLTITQATVSGAAFSSTGLSLPFTLAPGQSASFSVTFAPQSPGDASGSVAIASNASNPTLSITLSGTGSTITQGQGTLNVNPVNVGSVEVGTSGSQTGTLTAAGASVSVSSVSLGGTNASEFSVSGLSFPVIVTTSQPVSFRVTFAPSASGAASATASFDSTASNSPSTATLTGTGTTTSVYSVGLSWTASTTSGVTSYKVYRTLYGGSGCGPFSNIGSTPGSITTYTDSVVADGTTYCYATTAVDPSGESGYSNITQATIPASK